MTSNSIDYIGVSDRLPTNIKYFKEELICSNCYKKNKNPNIHKIISVACDIKINSIKLLNTQVRTSNEGQKLSGKKLLVELSISYRIKYISNSREKYIYILKDSITKIMYIAVPKEIKELSIEELIRKHKISAEPHVEDLYIEVRSFDEVYVRNLLLLNIIVKY